MTIDTERATEHTIYLVTTPAGSAVKNKGFDRGYITSDASLSDILATDDPSEAWFTTTLDDAHRLAYRLNGELSRVGITSGEYTVHACEVTVTYGPLIAAPTAADTTT